VKNLHSLSTAEFASVPAAVEVIGWRGMPRRVLIRRSALAAYGIAFITAAVAWGIPLERNQVIAWILAALACASIGRPRREIGRLVVDWLPFAILLGVYDLSRGAADTVGLPIHTSEMIDIDRAMFGGQAPTVWLQAHLVNPYPVQWYSVPFTLVYLSHFFVVYVVAGVLWSRNRDRFVAFVKRLMTLATAGLVTYILFPATPPWLAAQEGALGHVSRSSSAGMQVIGLHVSHTFERGQALVNTVAAMPSLHAAFAALVAIFLWPYARRGWRIVLALYPLAMGFALVATGEHYVTDVVVGWLYAAGVMYAWGWLDRRKRAAVSSPQPLASAAAAADYS
jgi:membrane-associated phospholipid phosphatase